MVTSSNIWPVVGIVLALLVGVFSGAYFIKPDAVAPIVVNTTSVAYDDSAVKASLNDTNAKLDALSKETLKDDLKESYAKELVYDEVQSRDFAKEMRLFLNDELNASGNSDVVEDYKDVFDIVVKDSDWTVSGTDASVELELKVYFYLDGDEDASNYALVYASLSVSDLEEDDDYEDAEVDSYDSSDFELKRFKFD